MRRRKACPQPYCRPIQSALMFGACFSTPVKELQGEISRCQTQVIEVHELYWFMHVQSWTQNCRANGIEVQTQISICWAFFRICFFSPFSCSRADSGEGKPRRLGRSEGSKDFSRKLLQSEGRTSFLEELSL